MCYKKIITTIFLSLSSAVYSVDFADLKTRTRDPWVEHLFDNWPSLQREWRKFVGIDSIEFEEKDANESVVLFLPIILEDISVFVTTLLEYSISSYGSELPPYKTIQGIREKIATLEDFELAQKKATDSEILAFGNNDESASLICLLQGIKLDLKDFSKFVHIIAKENDPWREKWPDSIGLEFFFEHNAEKKSLKVYMPSKTAYVNPLHQFETLIKENGTAYIQNRTRTTNNGVCDKEVQPLISIQILNALADPSAPVLKNIWVTRDSKFNYGRNTSQDNYFASQRIVRDDPFIQELAQDFIEFEGGRENFPAHLSHNMVDVYFDYLCLSYFNLTNYDISGPIKISAQDYKNLRPDILGYKLHSYETMWDHRKLHYPAPYATNFIFFGSIDYQWYAHTANLNKDEYKVIKNFIRWKDPLDKIFEATKGVKYFVREKTPELLSEYSFSDSLSELSLPISGNAAQAIDSAKNLEVKSYGLPINFSVINNGIEIAMAKSILLSIGLNYKLQDNSGNLLTKLEQKFLPLLGEFRFLTKNGVEYLLLKKPSFWQDPYYYDANGKRIAYLTQTQTLFLKWYEICNIEGTILYKIRQRFNPIGITYQIQKVGEGPITMKDAILSTVIVARVY